MNTRIAPATQGAKTPGGTTARRRHRLTVVLSVLALVMGLAALPASASTATVNVWFTPRGT